MKRYLLGLYEKSMPAALGWEPKLAAASSAGYDFIELSVDESEEKLERLNWTKSERADLHALALKRGVPIGSMCLSGHRKYPLGSEAPDIAKRSMEIMEKAIDLAVDLGVRLIQLAGYDVYYEDSTDRTRARFAARLEAAVSIAAAKGVALAFETMETDFMNTVAKAMFYVDAISSPYLQVYPDVGNLTNAAKAEGADVLNDLEKGRGHIAAIHLKETLPGVFREVPFGSGHVDFDAVIAKAWSMGVRRYVAEFWHVGNDDWKDSLYGANAMMRGKLDAQPDKLPGS
jgi:L-ribulose-5-phosphate 3-epimerase